MKLANIIILYVLITFNEINSRFPYLCFSGAHPDRLGRWLSSPKFHSPSLRRKDPAAEFSGYAVEALQILLLKQLRRFQTDWADQSMICCCVCKCEAWTHCIFRYYLSPLWKRPINVVLKVLRCWHNKTKWRIPTCAQLDDTMFKFGMMFDSGVGFCFYVVV